MLKKDCSSSKNRQGFTFIELLVVVLIISILVMVAIPGYYRVRLRVQEKKAIAALYDIYRADKAYFVDYQTYAPTDAQLQGYEDFELTGMDDKDWQYTYDYGNDTGFHAHAEHLGPYGGTDGIQVTIDQTGTTTRVNWPW